MANFLEGLRIEGSSTLTTSPPQTSWKELARITAGSGGSSSLTTSTFTPKDNLMILYNSIGADPQFRVGNSSIDTGANYALRRSEDYGSDGTFASSPHNVYWYVNGGASASGSEHVFGVTEGINISAQEKLFVLHSADNADGTGAGTEIGAYERAMKWANTSNQINIWRMYSSGTMAEGSEVVVLGCDNDEADSGTNFWQELSSVELSSGADTITTGATSAISKKYLYVKAVLIADGNIRTDVRLNNDDDDNYARRRSNNGASGSSATSESSIDVLGDSTHDKVVELFIVNKADKEKLISGNICMYNSADSAPQRSEFTAKWANTSDLISRITINNTGASGDYASGSYIKVWGAD